MVSHIFLLNFLIAILSTVYNIMMEGGEFEYKKNKYLFIEKYSVAMLNKWGYSELVMYPPPANFPMFFLLPFTFSKELMLSASKHFSKIMFWVENFVYIIFFFFYEFFLIPLVFFKVLYNIIKVSFWKDVLTMTFTWLIIGFFYLLFSCFKDCYNFLKILCDT